MSHADHGHHDHHGKDHSFLGKIKHYWHEFMHLEWIHRVYLAGMTLLILSGLIYGLFSLGGNGEKVPAEGGRVTEGIIGQPRFINPVLATSDVDKDITSLVFSGLLKKTATSTYEGDLAEAYEISPDGRMYTVTLKGNVRFHDGTPLTVQDVLFTISKLKDPVVRSPYLPLWQGVTVTSPDEKTIVFRLQQPRATFLADLTTGILSEERWKNTTSEEFAFARENVNPIGSGPFSVEEISYGDSGLPESIKLNRFEQYALKRPYLDGITLRFYEDEASIQNAYARGKIDAWARVPAIKADSLKRSTQVVEEPLSRAFLVFFNLRNATSSVATKANRELLNDSINREELVVDILNGYAHPLTTLSDIHLDLNWQTEEKEDIVEVSEGREPLDNSSSFSLTLTTVDIPELVEVAEYLSQTWREAGVDVRVETVSPEKITEDVLAPRAFEALLYGISLDRGANLASYFHSQEQRAGGLNISGYTNREADRLLLGIAQGNQENITSLSTILDTDQPVAFLYQPDLIYALPAKLKGIKPGSIETPRDRFKNVNEWYLKTRRK